MDYLNYFQENKHKYHFQGDRLLVELLENEEIKTESGIVIAKAADAYAHGTQTTHLQSQTARILLLPQEEDTGGLADWEKHLYGKLKPGSKVLLSVDGVRAYSQFPGVEHTTEAKIGLTLLQNIHAILNLDE